MMPVMFIGHGSPMNAIEDNVYSNEWKCIGKLYKPKGILMISAHWETAGTRIQSAKFPKKIDDMYGFPKELYDLKYPVSGDEYLTKRVIELTGADIDDNWGIDHGAWSILVHMFPDADVPVVQMSVNKELSNQEKYDLGNKLRVLREDGYMIIGSGNVVHSFKYMNMSGKSADFAITFDDAIEEAIKSGNQEKCIDYEKLSGAFESVPTSEHYDPLLYILGAAEDDVIEIFNKDIVYGAFSMTSYIFSRIK
jgi:4,5-DOPA dioxygenase extradiol